MTQSSFNIPIFKFNNNNNSSSQIKLNNLIELNEMEIFLFKTPDSKKTILVTELSKSITEMKLKQVFSEFGLIYDIKIYHDENKSTSMSLIKYYLERSAVMAHNASVNNQIEINGRQCNVMISKFKSEKEYDMPIERSIKAINKFLGFNQWSSEINQIERDYTRELMIENKDSGLVKKVYESRWASQVYCTLNQIGSKIQAIGFGLEERDTLEDAVQFAKKVAISNAKKEIFSKIGIILNYNDNTSIPFILDDSCIVLPPEEEDKNKYFDDSYLFEEEEEEGQQQQQEEDDGVQQFDNQQQMDDQEMNQEQQIDDIDIDFNDQEQFGDISIQQ